jgi:hypothetical protein
MSCPSPWLHPACCYKKPLKEEEGALVFAFCFLGLYFGPFGMGNFGKGKESLKGKMPKGKGNNR